MTAITDNQRQYNFSPQFEKVVNFILQKEGGYVNDPRDPGGETKYGISKRSYPTLDIRNLTENQAKEIYKRDFYDRLWGDSLPFAIILVLTDFAVNAGLGVAVRRAQTISDVKPIDGVFGKKTFAALAAINDIEQFVTDYTAARQLFYKNLVENNTKRKVYLAGWNARTRHAMQYALNQKFT
jgi:lysozyme family protein